MYSTAHNINVKIIMCPNMVLAYFMKILCFTIIFLDLYMNTTRFIFLVQLLVVRIIALLEWYISLIEGSNFGPYYLSINYFGPSIADIKPFDIRYSSVNLRLVNPYLDECWPFLHFCRWHQPRQHKRWGNDEPTDLHCTVLQWFDVDC